jgi:uncharacterized membrane protein YgdD (TMEM256/DUF423 family)
LENTYIPLEFFCFISLYVAALTKDKTFGKPAPYGGMLLIAAWLSMAL